MRNPWRMQDGPDNKINRNNFPMSFQYNGTFKYGKIYPIGLIRTIPGASYQIDSTLALNFMPTSFPIQTRQRAYVHYFYGRDRNFWKDYKDFVNGMNPDLVKPYIDEGITLARTGNLLDYLGVPTTIVGSYGSKERIHEFSLNYTDNLVLSDVSFNYGTYDPGFDGVSITSWDSIFQPLYSLLNNNVSIGRAAELSKSSAILFPISFSDSSLKTNSTAILEMSSQYAENTYTDFSRLRTTLLNNGYNYDLISPTPVGDSSFKGNVFKLIAVYNGKLVDIVSPRRTDSPSIEFSFTYNELYSYYIVSANESMFMYRCDSLDSNLDMTATFTNPTGMKLDFVLYSNASEVREIDFSTSPYWRSNDNRGKNTIKLNAIPPRMYETIYNLYYRNPQNNPYILNGKPEYNIFIPTKDGGPDSNLYELRYRNWEDDFLTTAVQTPQQGIAPLVGLTDRGATVTLTNEDGSVTRYVTTLDANGNVTGIETTDSSEPLLTQALIDAVSYGISIEDLRNVNAMQKWLELNLRKGYQYKDIIEARWGISISYNELDLPEFIGGFTQEVGLQAVTQTTSHGEGIEGALGWQAGRMYAAGSGRSITHYCEEEGYIMALLTVVPVPNYSQLLPKHWFTRDLLDSYQPEFNHIGFQPITYKEVCPIQAFQESTENVDVLEQTFGYQRPWYEYFNQVDEVHGQFRSTFKDFLINRTFDVKPELSESFLLVDPNQINDVFAVTTDDDKIIGAIEHRITAKLPISLYAQARLE